MKNMGLHEIGNTRERIEKVVGSVPTRMHSQLSGVIAKGEPRKIHLIKGGCVCVEHACGASA